jgi:hypothetical protein
MNTRKFSLFKRPVTLSSDYSIKSHNLIPEIHDTFLEDPKHRKSYNRLIDYYLVKDDPHSQAQVQMTDLPSYIKPSSFKDIITEYNKKNQNYKLRYALGYFLPHDLS